MILSIAIILFLAAVFLVKLAWKKKAENNKNPAWFLLQMAGSGIGFMSAVILYKAIS